MNIEMLQYKKMCKSILLISAVGVILLCSNVARSDYSTHPSASAFIDKMVKEHGFKRNEVIYVLKQAEKKQSILNAIARPAEKTKPWYEYRKIFLGKDRIEQGVEFWQKYKYAIQRASEKYKVDPEIIVAIIGVETRYGRHAGKHRVIDALATLGFDYAPRAKFFAGELEHFMLLAREQNQDPMSLKGSYAGAMGYGQFIPSSYRSYAVDFDEDGITDIWTNPVDAIGSVANYFNRHHWQYKNQVFVKAKTNKKIDKALLNSRKKPSLTQAQAKSQGFEAAEKIRDKNLKVIPLVYKEFQQGKSVEKIWLGLPNFYSITRYNRSRLYARAVWELSNEIEKSYRIAIEEKNNS